MRRTQILLKINDWINKISQYLLKNSIFAIKSKEKDLEIQ